MAFLLAATKLVDENVTQKVIPQQNIRVIMNSSIPKEKIIKVIEIFFPDAKIYLFGSRARNDYNERSDIDIAIDAQRQMTLTEIGQINSMIDALNIPQKTDIVDFNRAPQALKNNIIKEGILWKS